MKNSSVKKFARYPPQTVSRQGEVPVIFCDSSVNVCGYLTIDILLFRVVNAHISLSILSCFTLPQSRSEAPIPSFFDVAWHPNTFMKKSFGMQNLMPNLA
jgi:hypothetical protein